MTASAPPPLCDAILVLLRTIKGHSASRTSLKIGAQCLRSQCNGRAAGDSPTNKDFLGSLSVIDVCKGFI